MREVNGWSSRFFAKRAWMVAGLAVGVLTSPVALAQVCPDPSLDINIGTGQDVNDDGLDDVWSMTRPDGSYYANVALVTPNASWRGGSALAANTGPLGTARYPVLGDGRWIGDPVGALTGTYSFSMSFDLVGYSAFWISGEIDADNAFRIYLNGNDTGVGSNFNAVPPYPYLSNFYGTLDACADPLDGLLHPSCTNATLGPNCSLSNRCTLREDEFREMHYFEISSLANPAWFNIGGSNTLTVQVYSPEGASGLLITGGAGTSVTSGPTASPCPPELDDVRCGDGIVDPGEVCDDGNRLEHDGCGPLCKVEVCGDRILHPSLGETCDDGNVDGGDGCDSSCHVECPNGVIDMNEGCDDGNAISGDGCSATCKIEVCGDGIFHPEQGEACDDGNLLTGDGCDPACLLECSNGVVEGLEQCDDGNRIPGDGCSPYCLVETAVNVNPSCDPARQSCASAPTACGDPVGYSLLVPLFNDEGVAVGEVEVRNTEQDVLYFEIFPNSAALKITDVYLHLGDNAMVPLTTVGRPDYLRYDHHFSSPGTSSTIQFYADLDTLRDEFEPCSLFSIVVVGRLKIFSNTFITRIMGTEGQLTGGTSYCLQACPCTIGLDTWRTQTQGGWGTVASGDNPGTYRDANFDDAFPSGLYLGCSLYGLSFTSSEAVETFLPVGGKAKALKQSYVDPATNDVKNVLAGQVTALKLSVGFDAFDWYFGESDTTLGSLLVTEGPFAGMAVSDVLELGEMVLGGCDSSVSASVINDTITRVNEGFVDGTTMSGFWACPE